MEFWILISLLSHLISCRGAVVTAPTVGSSNATIQASDQEHPPEEWSNTVYVATAEHGQSLLRPISITILECMQYISQRKFDEKFDFGPKYNPRQPSNRLDFQAQGTKSVFLSVVDHAFHLENRYVIWGLSALLLDQVDPKEGGEVITACRMDLFWQNKNETERTLVGRLHLRHTSYTPSKIPLIDQKSSPDNYSATGVPITLGDGDAGSMATLQAGPLKLRLGKIEYTGGPLSIAQFVMSTCSLLSQIAMKDDKTQWSYSLSDDSRIPYGYASLASDCSRFSLRYYNLTLASRGLVLMARQFLADNVLREVDFTLQLGSYPLAIAKFRKSQKPKEVAALDMGYQ